MEVTEKHKLKCECGRSYDLSNYYEYVTNKVRVLIDKMLKKEMRDIGK